MALIATAQVRWLLRLHGHDLRGELDQAAIGVGQFPVEGGFGFVAECLEANLIGRAEVGGQRRSGTGEGNDSAFRLLVSVTPVHGHTGRRNGNQIVAPLERQRNAQ